MKTVFICMTAIAAASIAAPAAAQYQPNYNQNYPVQYQPNYNQSYPVQYQGYGRSNANDNMSRRIGQLQIRLQEGVRSGTITRREAGPISQNIQRLASAERQYGMNGYTGQERSALQQRIKTVRQQLRRADGGAQGRYAEWDREDQYGWNDHNNNNGRVDNNRDGWDDRDYNRNGRWDDDVNYGPQQSAPATGLAGIISSIFGGGELQVGQRAPSNLYGVPHQYQAQFRDGNGVYYRSDGRNIYQVDARSQTVVRIFRI